MENTTLNFSELSKPNTKLENCDIFYIDPWRLRNAPGGYWIKCKAILTAPPGVSDFPHALYTKAGLLEVDFARKLTPGCLKFCYMIPKPGAQPFMKTFSFSHLRDANLHLVSPASAVQAYAHRPETD